MITTMGVTFEKNRSSKIFESSLNARAPSSPNPILRAVPYKYYKFLKIITKNKAKNNGTLNVCYGVESAII